MKVLICGATGFVGRNLVETLKGHDVHATFHNRPVYDADVTWHHVDLCSSSGVDYLLSQGFDVVVQCAAITSGSEDTMKRPYIHTTENAVMNSWLLRHSHAHKVGHFIFISTSLMYEPNGNAWKESDWTPAMMERIHPAYFGVAWTKVYIEKMCEFYASLGVTKHTVLRAVNCYGPRDPNHHFIGALIERSKQGGTLQVWGDGKEVRGVLHVKDLARAVVLTIEKQATPFETYNISGDFFSVDEVARKISTDIEYVDGPTVKVDFRTNADKAREQLGWKAEISFEEGLAALR